MSIFLRFVRRLALLSLAACAAAAAGCGAGGPVVGGAAAPAKSMAAKPSPAVRSAAHRAETSFTMPADTNADYTVSPLELSSYALAFLKGSPWPQGPSPISPLALSTTALIFLKSSGTYHYDASQTPPYQMGPPGGQTVTVS
ncbi:MAG TPA: hypothetical protein VFJ58_10405 [Armatimonadota bacterium]|nr:hypothetical protein [Armatimonadota bacterium]